MPTKRAWNGRVRPRAGPEEPILGADEAHLHALGREVEHLAKELCVRLGVGDDDVRLAEGPPVDVTHHAGGGRSGPEAPAVVDERVVERHERVEDDGPAPGDPSGRRQVEVPGVADDEGLGAALVVARPPEAALGLGQSQHLPQADRPVVAPLPDGPVLLDDVDPGAAERGDDLRVSRVGAVVGSEVEDAQRLAQHFVHEAGGPVCATGSLLVLARDQLGEEPEREQLDADDDEEDAEQEQRPLADRVAGQLDDGQVARGSGFRAG